MIKLCHFKIKNRSKRSINDCENFERNSQFLSINLKQRVKLLFFIASDDISSTEDDSIENLCNSARHSNSEGICFGIL